MSLIGVMKHQRFSPLAALLCIFSSSHVSADPTLDRAPKLARPAPRYEVVDLGLLGRTSWASQINNAGVSVGAVTTNWGQQIGFTYSAAGGLVPDFGFNSQLTSQALGLNSGGDIVGSAMPNGATPMHAFFRKAGSSSVIDMHPAPFAFSAGKAVNKSQIVVGAATTAGYYPQAFVWDNARGTRMLPFYDNSADPVSYANDISEDNLIVGRSAIYCSNLQNSTGMPVTWSADRDGNYIVKALPMPTGSACGENAFGYGEALAIGANKEIVGYILNPGEGNRSAIWKTNSAGVTSVTTGELGTIYYDVNLSGQKVGFFRNSGHIEGGLYSGGGWSSALQLLGNIPNWDITSFNFYSINDNGDIVGDAMRTLGGVREAHAILLKKL